MLPALGTGLILVKATIFDPSENSTKIVSCVATTISEVDQPFGRNPLGVIRPKDLSRPDSLVNLPFLRDAKKNRLKQGIAEATPFMLVCRAAFYHRLSATLNAIRDATVRPNLIFITTRECLHNAKERWISGQTI